MIAIIYKEELVSFNRLKKIIKGSDGAIYTHLQKLQDAEYIKQKKDIAGAKMQTFYSLSPKGKKLFKDYLKFMEDIVKNKQLCKN